MRISLSSVLLLLLRGILANTTSLAQPVILQHPIMSSTGQNDTREDLGDIDYRFFGSEGRQGPDDSIALLDEFLTVEPNCHLHSRGCWGFYIIRTCFDEGDDRRVLEAMDKLEMSMTLHIQLARHFSMDNEPGLLACDADLKRRLHNVLISDVKLKDASIADIREYLQAWFATIPEPRNGPRFDSFILLDSSVARNLEQLPKVASFDEWEPIEMHPQPQHGWVKLVDVDGPTGSTCKVWAWHLVYVTWSLMQGSYGVSEIPRIRDPVMNRDDGDDWLFYEP